MKAFKGILCDSEKDEADNCDTPREGSQTR